MSSHHNRLLLDTDNSMTATSFDSNMVIILAALLCALLCALGINSIARCALRCTSNAVVVGFMPDSVKRERDGPSQISVATYKVGLNVTGSDCPICLGEFVHGEDVGIFPKCNHGFHVKCINRWLVSHSSCPTCRQPLLQNGEGTQHQVSVIEIR